MNKNLYKNMNVNDFDKFDCVKLSWWLYLSVAYISRGYLVWILSIANISDGTSFIRFVYPEPALLYINLASGVMGIALFIIVSLRRPNANNKIKAVWLKIRTLIFIVLFIDFIVNLTVYYFGDYLTLQNLLFHSGIILLLVVKGVNNDRLKLNLIEFPADVEADKK